jgi:hypothetical protein
MRANLATWLSNRHGYRIGMNIESNKSYQDIGDHPLSYAALRRWIHLFAA